MTNFSDILNKPMDEIERPKPLPTGTYRCLVKGAPEFGNIGKENTPVANFTLAILEAQPDVDSSALADAGGISEKTVRHRLFLTEAALYRLKEFLEHLGIDGGQSLAEAIMEAPGRQCYVTLKHRPSQDGTQIYHEIASTAKV